MQYDNPITCENARPGSLDWQLTRVHVDVDGIRSPFIEGYCSHQSIEAGETLEIMVSTNPPVPFEIEFFRLGYYGGRGARFIQKMGPFTGKVQPEAPEGENRLRECRWEAALSLTIPQDWVSGVYLGRLTTLPGEETIPYWQSYVIFIVRDNRPAGLIFQCSDNTWQAYNRWPNHWSLYTNPRGQHAMGTSVSFNRPYGKYAQIFEAPQSVGSGEFLLWEFPFAFWLEEQGYDVTYVSNSDVLDSSQLTRGQVFLSVGHDEYWDVRQYEAVQEAIAKGVSVLWLGGNDVFGVTPFSADATGREKRTLTRVGIYGGLTEEEIDNSLCIYPKTCFRGPDEKALIGARTAFPCNGGGDWVCTHPEHWIFAGTDMKQGDAIRGLVGWEHHDDPADIPGLEVVGQGITWQSGTRPTHWTATVFYGPQGNVVFNASTIFWAQGLSAPPGHMLPWSHFNRPHGVDERVQKITRNVLQRALGSRTPLR